MIDILVVVADATRVRLFSLDRRKRPDATFAPVLIEREDLVNPIRRKGSAEVFTDSRPGLQRGGGSAHGVDDHRDAHMEEFDRRFSTELVEAAVKAQKETSAKKVLLIASPHMLGIIRKTLGPLTQTGATIEELAKDVTQLSPTALHDRLASASLIPGRKDNV